MCLSFKIHQEAYQYPTTSVELENLKSKHVDIKIWKVLQGGYMITEALLQSEFGLSAFT